MERKDLSQLPEEKHVIVEDANAKKSGKATLPSDPDKLITGRLMTTKPIASRLTKKTLSVKNTRKKTDANLHNVPNLIGDMSKPLTLPVLHSGTRHSDLPTISSSTLARLLRGHFFKLVSNNYQIIDCRYPYEFDGGHICGARNLYTRDQIKAAFPAKPSGRGCRNKIYIFHCEFSSQRGPTLMRFLRTTDRKVHSDDFPALDYPELYLLHEGYKEFHANYTNLCNPNNYVPMLAPEHARQFKLFYNISSDGGSLKRSRVLLKCHYRRLFDDSNVEPPANKSNIFRNIF